MVDLRESAGKRGKRKKNHRHVKKSKGKPGTYTYTCNPGYVRGQALEGSNLWLS
jgi:hypothetical protein